MRHPEQRRNVSLAVGIIAATAFGVTLAMHRNESPLGAWYGVVIVSAFSVLFSAVGVVVFHANHRMRQRLERGEKRLAEWTLSPAEWTQFAADELARRDAGRGNNVRVRATRADVGVDVLIAENAIMIGGDFYHLGRMRGLQWLPDALPCLEYNMVTAGKSGSVRWNVRIPVAAGAELKARAVWDYVHRPRPIVDASIRASRFRRARVGGLLVAAMSTPFMVFAMTYYGNPSRMNQVGWSMVISMLCFPLGLFVAGLSHWILRIESRGPSSTP